MDLTRIRSWFTKKAAPIFKPTPSSTNPIRPRITIPYPEEFPDHLRTAADIDPRSALVAWENKYRVPVQYRRFWEGWTVIQLDPNLPYPAATYEQGGVRYIKIRPEWVNPGVIAHEQAHGSYALLSGDGKREFAAGYTPLKTAYPLIVLLYSQNRYGLTSDVEGHAEIYRYLGERMPEALKKYYPRLF